jgi:hypothetical protein
VVRRTNNFIFILNCRLNRPPTRVPGYFRLSRITPPHWHHLLDYLWRLQLMAANPWMDYWFRWVFVSPWRWLGNQLSLLRRVFGGFNTNLLCNRIKSTNFLFATDRKNKF